MAKKIALSKDQLQTIVGGISSNRYEALHKYMSQKATNDDGHTVEEWMKFFEQENNG